MKRLFVLLIAIVTALTICVPAFAAETAEATEESADKYPVIGSWILDKVYDKSQGEEPVLLEKDEAQSLYGSGISVFTFDDEGYAHETIFDAGDMVDIAATWKTTSPDVYTFENEDGFELILKYDKEADTLVRNFKDDTEGATYKDIDFVYARAITGSWQLDRVLEVHEGDAPEELDKETNQSLYGSGESVITFFSDGTSKELVNDGGEAVIDGTWKMTDEDIYIYTSDGLDIEFNYFRVDDTIYRDFKDDSPNAEHPYLSFIYVRVETPEGLETDEKAEEKETQAEVQPAKQQEAQPAKQQEAQPAKQPESQQAPQPAPEDELINGGQIFTGHKMYNLKNEATGEEVTLSELSQGGWANEATGEIFTQEAGGGEHFYGDRGTVLVIFDPSAELINDGQIFTGNTISNLINVETGEYVVLSELSQGGWANEATGEIFTQEPGGGDHFYGQQGTTLIFADAYTGPEVDELINGGQIFTGYTIDLININTAEIVTLSELSQGGYVNEATGEMFYLEGGGGDHFYGDQGTVLVFEDAFYDNGGYEQPYEGGEDELIADGQIFTGYEMTLYDSDTGAAVVVKGLNQGGWANEATGEIFTQEEGGGDHFYGNYGTVLISEWLYFNGGQEELVADGQIFSGNKITLYNPATGEAVVVSELNQGGWANEATGEIFTQEEGGGDHFYGNYGSELVSEWYYNVVILGAEG